MLPDPANSLAAFQLSVGEVGMNNGTIRLPKNFTLSVPGYSCGHAKIVKPTKFYTPDGRRVFAQAFSKLKSFLQMYFDKNTEFES